MIAYIRRRVNKKRPLANRPYSVLHSAFSYQRQAKLLVAAFIYYSNYICPLKSGSVNEYTAYGQLHITCLEDILNL